MVILGNHLAVLTQNVRVFFPEVTYFNCDNMIFGYFHQGDEIFSDDSHGSQCMINSLVALIYAENITSAATLDKVLTEGDSVNKQIIIELKAMERFKSRLFKF